MRCKKHPSDLSSTVGVCASCLSERLLSLIAAQSQTQAQLSRANSRATIVDSRNSDAQPPIPPPPPPPPLIFPRSVSPYVAPRHKSNHLLFYSTPQVGPTYNYSNNSSCKKNNDNKKKHARFSLLSKLFRSRSEKFHSDSDPDLCTNSYTSPSWFSTIFSSSTRTIQKQSAAENSSGVASGAPHRRRRKTVIDRGMSPDSEEDCDRSPPSGSGSSSESTSSHWWKRTPVAAVRRSKTGHLSSSGLAFCLSPLVRASPNRHWNQKGAGGLPPDIRFSGEVRAPVKPHLSTAASFCGNRSRKLCDFGRVNHN